MYACLKIKKMTQMTWNSLNYQQNKLTPDEALNIEGPLTITEIGAALKGMKHNKTPSIDGFPAKFYKMFWAKLKYFVLRALNYSFSKGILLLSLRQTIIRCLPETHITTECIV